MNNELFSQCLESILKSDRPGFGFVQDFSSFLLSQDYKDTHVRNVVSIWDYEINGKVYSFDSFSSITLNLYGIKRSRLLDSKLKHITSHSIHSTEFFSPYDFLWYNHFAAILLNSGSNGTMNPKGAILLLSNSDDILFSDEQLDILHCVFNSKSIECNIEMLEDMSADEVDSIIPDRHKETVKMMSNYYQKSIDSPGICYFNVWKLNDINHHEEYLKQYEHIVRNNCSLVMPSEIHMFEKHPLNDLRSRFSDQKIQSPIIIPFSDMESSLEAKIIAKRIDTSSLSVVFVPVIINGPIISLDIFCFYVKDILFTPFISDTFRMSIHKQISSNTNHYNTRTRANLLTELMRSNVNLEQKSNFYKEVSNKISNINGVEDCLIYIKNDVPGVLLYAIEEDLENPSSRLRKNAKIGQYDCHLPGEYYDDKNFLGYLNGLDILDNTKKNTFFYRGLGHGIVNTAICICIRGGSLTESSGLIILVNKHKSVKNKSSIKHDIMSMDCAINTYLSSIYLYQYGLWTRAISRKNYLLRKLRHEIPHCTAVIGGKINDLKDSMPSRHHDLLTIELNKNRIEMLAKFFGAVDYKDERFAESKKAQDIVEIIDSNLPIFKEDAFNKGVDVVVVKHVETCVMNISDFYPLAIINVVNNAIKYCAEGTSVIIDIYEDRIEVSDMGIGIGDDEIDNIFNDGFRGVAAKSVDASGIGYGLHISRRVLKAHNSTISVTSERVASHNYLLETEINNYIKSLSKDEKKKFIYNTVEEPEYLIVNQLLNRIALSNKDNLDKYNRYFNLDRSMLSRWLEDDVTESLPAFIEMDECWFSKPLFCVTFTINFNQ